MPLTAKELSAQRNSKHMRNALGFYPFAAKDAEGSGWESTNARAVEWLRESKISGRNAREKYGEIAAFAEILAAEEWAHKSLPSLEACRGLAFATLFAAMGSFEAFLSRKRRAPDAAAEAPPAPL